MDAKERAKITRRLTDLHQQLASVGPLMRGSVVMLGTRNKYPYFSLNKDKKTKIIYLGKKREAKARQYSENYQRLMKITEEMTLLNMALLKDSGKKAKNL